LNRTGWLRLLMRISGALSAFRDRQGVLAAAEGGSPMKTPEIGAVKPGTESPNHSVAGKIRIHLVEDHPVYRHGLIRLLSAEQDMELAGVSATGEEALERIGGGVDVVVSDLVLPGMSGVQLIAELKEMRPEMGAVALSMHDGSHYALAALQAGARAYVIKHESSDLVAEAIRAVHRGGVHLSPRHRGMLIFQALVGEWRGESVLKRLSGRELEILRMLGHGRSTRQVAETLEISVKTVETHRAHIKDKLNFPDAESMVRFAVDWVGLEQGRPSRKMEAVPVG
jgi:DNA-binding NarL/FixJ family response regulator